MSGFWLNFQGVDIWVEDPVGLEWWDLDDPLPPLEQPHFPPCEGYEADF